MPDYNDLIPYVRLMLTKGASEIFMSVGAAPNIKVDGVTQVLEAPAFRPGDVRALAYGIMSEKQIAQFESTMEMNLSISLHDVGRFRVNVYQQRGEAAMLVRHVKPIVPCLEELSLPPILEKLVMLEHGLVLIVGATGAGKSTTLASMIDYRNQREAGHILCIEDPIEFLHHNRKCVVDQREVGIDTVSYGEALKNALLEAPDVLAVGEIRDRETMQHAITYANTGRLCLATLHAGSVSQAIERIISFFPEEVRRQLLLDLGINLHAIVSQKLVAGTAARRVPAVEVMLLTPLIADLMDAGRLGDIKTVMEHNNETGMMTLDQSLYALHQQDKISLDEALRHAESRTDLKFRIQLADPVRYRPAALETVVDLTGRSPRK